MSDELPQLALTPAQASLIGSLACHMHGAPQAHVVAVGIDLSRGPGMRVTSTTGSAILFAGGGVVMLKQALALLCSQTDIPQRAEVMDAILTALPFLEAAILAKPDVPSGSVH